VVAEMDESLSPSYRAEGHHRALQASLGMLPGSDLVGRSQQSWEPGTCGTTHGRSSCKHKRLLFGASRSPGASGVFVVGSRLPPHLACTVVVGSSWFMLQLKRTWNLGVAVSQACLWDYFPRQLLVRAARLQGRRCM